MSKIKKNFLYFFRWYGVEAMFWFHQYNNKLFTLKHRLEYLEKSLEMLKAYNYYKLILKRRKK